MPLDLTSEELARHIGVPVAVLDEVLAERSPVTPRLAWLLGMATGTGPELWMNLQAHHDLAVERPDRELAPLRAS